MRSEAQDMITDSRVATSSMPKMKLKKEGLIAEVEARLKQKVTKSHLFTIRWVVS
jgi:hypothetical protein